MKQDEKPFDYQVKMTELETLLAELQQPDISIDEALQMHEKGTKLAQEISDYLESAEVTIRKRIAQSE